MFLKQIIISDFRNFKSNKFEFNPYLTIIIGENACGKTNLLEAIFFLIHGNGFREDKEEELISFEKDRANVEAEFDERDNIFNFQIGLTKKDKFVEKIFYINRVKKKYNSYVVEQTKSVLFTPSEIEIITASPDVRRSYFNKFISTFDLEYKKRLNNYETAIKKRNKVLEFIQDEGKLKEELVFWNGYLEEQAVYIQNKRQEYVGFLNNHEKVDNRKFVIKYLKNQFDKKRLEEFFTDERRHRRTLIGPQKDNFTIFEKEDGFEKNLQHFGSRSEQRLAVFWLKYCEVKYCEENLNKKPIILLDDVFSEFDIKNKKLVLELIKKYQTVVTTTEKELLHLIDMPKSIINI